MQTRDILFDILDQQTLPVGDTIYPKEPNMDVELIIEEIKGGMTSLDVSIIKLKEEIESYTNNEMPVHIAKGFDFIVNKLSQKIITELKTKVLSKLAISKKSRDPT